ncbi:MAG TPA: NUDIX hydrolase [Pirellulales bacterium]
MPELSYHRDQHGAIDRGVTRLSQEKTLLEARRFRVVSLEYRDGDGRPHTREVVRHPGAVTILPLISPDRVCLIRNYRAGVDQTLLELPAGTLEPGEDPRNTALRELQEETGYQAQQMELLCEFYTSPGILDELMRLYVATGLTVGPQRLDEGEEIETQVVDWDECLRLVQQGAIRDGKSLVGILLYDNLRRNSGGEPA